MKRFIKTILKLCLSLLIISTILILGYRTYEFMRYEHYRYLDFNFNEIFKWPNKQHDDWRLILVNYDHPLPNNYELELLKLDNGSEVDVRIYPELQAMFDDARDSGLELFVRDGYRSHEEQIAIMDDYIDAYLNEGYDYEIAKEKAEDYVAIPGTSEHELGLSVDINADNAYVEDYEVYDWLDQNAHQYGFIKRYNDDKIAITKINNEPWHYRYVGVEHATYMHEHNLCLEEYLAYLDD